MCGILTILNIRGQSSELRKKALEMAKKLRHRGPDWSGIFSDEHAILAHERLSIVDVNHGAQPLYYKERGLVLAVNGEIYNHQELRKQLKGTYQFQTNSDCEVILYLYHEYGANFLNMLNGIFAFVLYDQQKKTFMVARDPIGVIPLYRGWDTEGNLYVASEMKAIVHACPKLEEFLPGHYSTGSDLQSYYQPAWYPVDYMPHPESTVDLVALREAFESAVKRQLMCDVPYGVLLSGGLDSSLVAAVTKKFSKDAPAWWPQVHSFSVGLSESPDLKAAKVVADYLGTIHHEIHFTIQEGLDVIPDVIYHLETFDVTTIRAATPMYLMTRKIKAMGIKMVLSGEGSDEIFGGYLYFHKAPNAKEFHQETVRKLKSLYKYDCLRANKATAAWGVEARVPFLDREFLDFCMSINPQEKMITKDRMEKYILRKAFEGMLPPEILWRQKEQFSDGVGYSWIDSLKEYAQKEISDKMMENATYRFATNTPLTKEAYWYRSLFESHFPTPAAVACIPSGPSIACSTPTAILWDQSFAANADPSGRAVKDVHLK
jgi:asparagine synthase (glutamine-hydrolysing)